MKNRKSSGASRHMVKTHLRNESELIAGVHAAGLNRAVANCRYNSLSIRHLSF